MGAGFGEDGNPPVAGLGNVIEGFGRRHMHHIQRRFGQFRDTDGPVRGLALGGRRPGAGVIDGIVVARRDGFFYQRLDDQAVLRMHAT